MLRLLLSGLPFAGRNRFRFATGLTRKNKRGRLISLTRDLSDVRERLKASLIGPIDASVYYQKVKDAGGADYENIN